MCTPCTTPPTCRAARPSSELLPCLSGCRVGPAGLAPATRDGQPAVAAEVLRRDLRAGWVLPTFPLGQVHEADDLVYDVGVVAGLKEGSAAHVALDVVGEHRVQHFVGRQSVLVQLPRCKLGGRWLVDDLLGD